jgi:hypothetical protein
MIEFGPWRPHAFSRRGNARAELGLWDLASNDYAQALELGTDDWWRHALSLAMQEFCAWLVDAQLNLEDANGIDGIAWICTLAPEAVSDFDFILKMSEQRAYDSRADGLSEFNVTKFRGPLDRPGRYVPVQNHAQLNTYGSLLYRAGRCEAAIETINKGINARGDGGIPKDWLFLAMAHHHLDCADEALRWLEKVGQWLDESLHSRSSVSVCDNLPLIVNVHFIAS